MTVASPAGAQLAVAEVLRIADQDAQTAYRDLSGFKILAFATHGLVICCNPSFNFIFCETYIIGLNINDRAKVLRAAPVPA